MASSSDATAANGPGAASSAGAPNGAGSNHNNNASGANDTASTTTVTRTGAGGGGGGSSGSASAPPDPETLVSRLQDGQLDVRAKLQVVVEVKEMLEMFHSFDYGRFLKAFVPAYIKLLAEVPCAFSSDAPEQVRSQRSNYHPRPELWLVV